MSPDRLRRAEALYVLRGLPLTNISARYELSLRELETACRENAWDNKRIAHLTETSIATDSRVKAISQEADPLKRHSLISDMLVAQAQDLAMALGSIDMGDVMTTKLLRSRAETLRTIAETAERAVKLSREARGLVLGVASTQDKDDHKGVTYTVVMKPTLELPPAN